MGMLGAALRVAIGMRAICVLWGRNRHGQRHLSERDEGASPRREQGTELKNGNSNHAPMVAEALCAMGRPDAVMPWMPAIARCR